MLPKLKLVSVWKKNAKELWKNPEKYEENKIAKEVKIPYECERTERKCTHRAWGTVRSDHCNINLGQNWQSFGLTLGDQQALVEGKSCGICFDESTERVSERNGVEMVYMDSNTQEWRRLQKWWKLPSISRIQTSPPSKGSTILTWLSWRLDFKKAFYKLPEIPKVPKAMEQKWKIVSVITNSAGCFGMGRQVCNWTFTGGRTKDHILMTEPSTRRQTLTLHWDSPWGIQTWGG